MQLVLRTDVIEFAFGFRRAEFSRMLFFVLAVSIA